MSTLADMLEDKAEYPGGGVSLPDALDVFKGWLKTVGLPDYYSLDKHKKVFSTTESTRKLLITLIDEP